MRRGLLKLVDTIMSEGAAELAALIEETKRKGSEAYTEIERLEGARRSAASFEAARAIDDTIARLRWVIDRADAAIPALEEQLADAKWDEREAAFEKHKRLLMAVARKSFSAIEQAARA